MRTITEKKDRKLIFWFVFFILLFLPVSNTFFVNISKFIKSLITNTEYKQVLNKLNDENSKLSSKYEYYKSSEGLKMLIKDKLNKVHDGELIIRYTDMQGQWRSEKEKAKWIIHR